MHDIPHPNERAMGEIEGSPMRCDVSAPIAAVEASAIAIVGMAGRFPGAPDVDAFWRKLCAGEECLTRFTAAELLDAGIPRSLVEDPSYVPVNGILSDIEQFDAGFFAMNPREASITDPQHRIFLELAWHALEHSGHDAARHPGTIGVYAGCGASSYLLSNIYPNRADLAELGEMRIRMASSQEYLATRLSYKLNLTGPSLSINTACSTSLVAVQVACDALLNFQCNLAISGGVSVQVPQVKGYLHAPAGILSPDGKCRAFDAAASGTVSGNGGAVVVLKRLSEAIAHRDTIYAVIRGSAINNDGNDKAGYTAPSVRGQAQAIIEAQDIAGVSADSIGYVEAHGTGTPLGDPIEFAALTRAFRRHTDRRQFCAIGSVKSNVGHLDEAAGVTGLIKAALSLYHRKIPPSLHFQTPNPELAYEDSPFFVNAKLRDFAPGPDRGRRRAAVSSFGIGGTNAHVVLEEAPEPGPARPTRAVQLLPISARSADALAEQEANLAAWLAGTPVHALADIAHTLQLGRRAFAWRNYIVCGDGGEAAAALREARPARGPVAADAPPVVFMFTGQGSQYPAMAQSLYQCEPVFREAFDTCADILRPRLGLDPRNLIYAAQPDAGPLLRKTALAQPVLFAVEYALAQLWNHWGVVPAALIGHSLGEYVAACLAGVLELEQALSLVVRRGQLMQAAPPGGMLALPLAPESLLPRLPDDVEIAAVNARDRCVVGGPVRSIELLAAMLRKEGIEGQVLGTSHAFHTATMDGVLAEFGAELRHCRLQAPNIPVMSNVTGDWLRAEEATSPDYYLRHLRQPIRFGDGIAAVLRDYPDAVLLEVGPGHALVQAARRSISPETTCVASLPSAGSTTEPYRVLMASLGELWARGIAVDWSAAAEPERRRVGIPGYPFQRQRHWIEARSEPPATPQVAAVATPTKAAADRRCRVPVWRSASPVVLRQPQGHWLLLADAAQDDVVAQTLLHAGCSVTRARQMRASTVRPVASHAVGWDDRESYEELLRVLPEGPCDILWLSSHGPAADWRAEDWCHGLTALLQALERRPSPVRLSVIASGIAAVLPGEAAGLAAEKGTLSGFLRAAAAEFPNHAVQLIDVAQDALADAGAVAAMLALCQEQPAAVVTALRQRQRWLSTVETAQAASRPLSFRKGGTYLITGGLGGIGLCLAEYLAREWQARLILAGRSAVPSESDWPEIIADPATASSMRHMLRQLHALRELGATVVVERADIAYEAEAARVIAQTLARFGALHGVIHAAGIADGALLARQDKAAMAAVLAPKVAGTRVLTRLLAGERLDFVMLCSALSAVIGAPGQAAYCAANSYLDQLALTAGLPWPVVSVGWDAWRDVGMAARSVAPPRRAAGHPLLLAQDTATDGSALFQARLSPQRDWVLAEHRVGEQCLLPGTAYLDLAYAAARSCLGADLVQLQDVVFLQPLLLAPSEEAIVELAVSAADGGHGFSISSRVGNGPSRLHAEGRMLLAERGEPLHVDAPSGELIAPNPVLVRRLGQFGARWQCICGLYGKDQAELALPTVFIEQDRDFSLHPGLLDVATGFAVLDRQPDPDLLPFGYRRITIDAPLTPRVRSRVTRFDVAEDGLHLDLVIADEQDRVLLAIEDYHLRRVGRAAVAENVGLAIEDVGQLNGLHVAPCPRPAPGPDEVEIEVFAAGLNFKEVLYASGLLPQAEGAGWRFGLECAGRISRVGADAGARPCGEAVIAYGAGCLQKYAIIRADQVLALPAGLSFAQGASLPAALLTAHYALIRQARLRRGETVLIHAAAGGVGLAAVQIARQAGATILCTAGAPHKRAYLQELGVAAVFDSRSLDFVEGVRRFTGGKGVDVVLNALAGELMVGGLDCLAPYGRFLELGVKDIHEGRMLDLRRFARAISFTAISVGPGMPDFTEMFRDVIDQVRTGALTPPPHQLFPLTASRAAFEHMARSRHIGKVVIGLRPEADRPDESGMSRDGFSAAEGAELFRKALQLGHPHLVIARDDPATGMARVGSLPPGIGPASSARTTRPQLNTPFAEPTGRIETELAALLAQLLGVFPVGRHDDFFSLGGDSLIGTQLIAQANRVLGSGLALRDLFESPTVAGLAVRSGTPLAATEGIPPAPLQPHYPLTRSQRRMWILAQNEIASIAYNMSYSLTLRGALDVPALRKAFGLIVARHESLRTAFITVAGEPRARIMPAQKFMLPLHDLQDETDPAAAAGRMIAAVAHEPLSLDRPPLLRPSLLRLSEGEHILLVTVHHIVADGLSLNVLMRELNQAYGAFAAGSAPMLAPLPVQATDIAVWQEQQIATGALRGQQAYWVEKLSGPIHSLELPVDRARPLKQQFRGDQIALHLSSDRKLLQRCCQEQSVSLFMLLVAALKVVLHQVTGADDILVGSPVSNRERPEFEGQIGHYLNTLVLRDTVHRNETFAVLLQRVRTTVREALAHQSYPFDLLVEELKPRPAAGHQPLFDVQINLMPGEAPSLRLGELSVEGLATNSGTTIFDLNFMFSETASGLALEIGYAAALFEPATVARLGNALLRVLVAAAREPGRTVRSLCALADGGDGERERADFLKASLQLDEDF
jgi:acyl transferase domain-containing protein